MFKRAAFVLALILAQAVAPLSALAVNNTVETAAQLDAAHASVSDTLVGDSGGAYRFFAIDYPGGGVPIPITMTAQPGRGTAGIASGFKVYGPTGFVGDSIGDDRSTTSSTYAFTLAHTIPGTYYVQVFNYIAGMPMTFQLSVAGLAPPPAPPALAPAPAPEGAPAAPAPPAPTPTVRPANTTPENAIVLTQTSSTTGGVLAGKRDGNFNYYWLDYPGGNTDMTMTVGYSPITATSDKAVGFKLYRADPTKPEGAVLAGESAETGRGESSATAGFTLNAGPAERYLLQVYNYLDNITINYTLIVTGLAGPVADIGDTASSPDKAFLLAPGKNLAASGAFAGDPSGRFQFFILPYPGNNTIVKVTVTAQPNSQIGDGMFGVNLYDGSNNVGTAAAGVDERGRRSATIVINQSDAKIFGIQVYNYSNTVAKYTISITGL